MYGTILVPVDGSDPSRTALDHAVGLADEVNATVHVFTVVEPSRSSLTFGTTRLKMSIERSPISSIRLWTATVGSTSRFRVT
ncbi:universal stress protein [Haloplanus sp. GCM10025708]|uniref:universal stress protein n=1 Tax=Haloferacaceae TaxID=1644056 RepID=UPI00361A47E5